MNIWHLVMIAVFLTIVSVSSPVYASTCDVKQTTLTTPQQFYRVSDTVFVGTISEISNHTDQQYKIQFNAEKIWKGAQTPEITLTAGSLQACGYSLVKGEKYLVFANGSPLFLNSILTKPFTDAQDIISVYNDTQFQSEESTKESMIKRLENAKDAISIMMGSHNTSGIQFNMVGVDVLNATLDVGIDSTKATLTKAEYEEKIKEMVGDIPMNVELTQIWTTTGNNLGITRQNDSSERPDYGKPDIAKQISPLQQFKSGISVLDVKCAEGFTLIIKSEGGSPACVRPDTAQILTERGWAKGVASTFLKTNSIRDASFIKLHLATNSTIIKQGQAIGIDIGLNNTSASTLAINYQKNWSMKGLVLQPCTSMPFGIALFGGNYSLEDIAESRPLPTYRNGTVHCNMYRGDVRPDTTYVFQPSSDNAFLESRSGNFTDEMFDHFWLAGFYRNNKLEPFTNGTYTIVGGDMWGHLAIQHFTVANSAETYTTSISQPTTVQTNDLHGTINDIAVTTPFTELASSSSGIQIARGGCCDSYDNDSIKLELYHGKRSGSDVIAATVDNVGKRTVHVYGIRISGFIQFTNSSGILNLMVLEDEPDITPKEDAILGPGESQTKYIVGNWTSMGRQVNGFSVGTSYSYDDLENYNGVTNGYDMTVPVQWMQQ